MKRVFTFLTFMLIAAMGISQSFQADQIAEKFLKDNLEELNLSPADIQNYTITDMYQTKHNGVTHVYMVQTIDGIQVHNAMINVNIMKDGQIPYHGNRFVKDLNSKISSKQFTLAPEKAVKSFASDINVSFNRPLVLKTKSANTYIFEKTEFTRNDLKVEKKYFPTKDGKVVPTWEVTADMSINADYWNTRVNATSGEVIDKHNYTVYCTHAKGQYSRHHKATCKDHDHGHDYDMHIPAANALSSSMLMDGMYRVYPIPAESPNHGDHELITQPVLGNASPFGWHDRDGAEGADYTITRGNNVHAYQDSGSTNMSSGDEPDGGAELVFDYGHNLENEPGGNQDAAITNLFYMNNMMHDITYLLGFDEASGNFQQNNYSNGGIGNDYVLAEGLDGSGTDNANFATPADGNSGRMQMFLWNQAGSILNVTAPQPLEGGYEFGASSNDGSWGYANYDDFNLEEEIVLAFDGSSQNATQCCSDIVNDSEIAGKIALIDRGGCEFGSKALNAQNNGAVACIICNVAGVNGGDGDEFIGMAGGQDGTQVTIPTVFMRKSDCDRFRASINSGTSVVMRIAPTELDGPSQLSGSFDNGIIAHEYGHGISNRLTGGPSNAGCLGNDEQMGEGWSDIFTLFYTARESDSGADPRGIGTYAIGEGINGRGIRRFPYSTDMSVNPQTFDDIKGTTAPHPLGEVWVAACWDLFWAFVDLYGFDADWTNTESGNFKAAQLVVDGMKFQPCSPGFVDGRDALITADFATNNGEHHCLIWDVFARRGLGIAATQGSSQDRNDGTEDFQPLATCIEELKINKTMTELVTPGENIEISLLIRNHTLETKDGVIVTDQIPENTFYVDGSSNIEPIVNGNTISWDLGSMATLDETTITYQLNTDSGNKSQTLFYDDLEEGQDNFTIDIGSGDNFWGLTGFDANSGVTSISIADFYTDAGGFNIGGDTRLVMTSLDVVGENPALRFWHKYDTESGPDGGFVEVSLDGGNTWRNVTDNMFRNGYNTVIAYGTLAIPSLDGFSGTNNTEWIDTYIDLNEYKGQTATFRWRFATDGENSTLQDAWFIDDFEMLDIKRYTAEACVEAEDGSSSCDTQTTLIDSDLTTSTEDEVLAEDVDMKIFPNPAGDYTSIQLSSGNQHDARVSILSMDGKILFTQPVNINNNLEIVTVNTADLASGFYVVRLESGKGILTQKLIIE